MNVILDIAVMAIGIAVAIWKRNQRGDDKAITLDLR